MGNLELLTCVTMVWITVCSAQVQQIHAPGESQPQQECLINDMKAQVEQLTSRLDDAFVEINRLKKLLLATLNMMLSPEQETCLKATELNDIQTGLLTTSGCNSGSCIVLGTANYPALSCEQLLEACQVPSGIYYIRGPDATFHKMFCDMDSFEGGWTRFGKGNMSSEWNYTDEDSETVTLDIISQSDIQKMIKLGFTEFKILTDVQFWLQADDSINPSSLSVNFLPSLTPGDMHFDTTNADHTHLVFDAEGDHIECYSGSSSRCGYGGTPDVGTQSQQLLIRSAFFGPRAPGASITYSSHQGQWRRNKYTWNGSYYYVLAK